MEQRNLRPLRWDDSVVRHRPESLPFLHFFLEVREATHNPRFANRARQWLRGQGEAVSIPPEVV
jgi:hypothetical protein